MLHLPAYVKNDKDLMRFFSRTEKRDIRYPNWRQIFYDCNGLCQYPVKDSVCAEIDGLEFHEMYDTNGCVCNIVLLCNYHHHSIHNGIVNPRYYKSKLQLDIEIEMKLSGSLEEWKNKFKIIDREVKYDFKSDNWDNTLDLQFSEDS